MILGAKIAEAKERKFEVGFLADYSDEALLDELRRIALLIPLDQYLTKTAYAKNSPRASTSTLQRRFGSWQRALELAGLGARYRGTFVSEKMKSQPSRSLSNNDLLVELKRVHKVVGTEWLTRADFNVHSVTSDAAVRLRFGSFRKGLDLAGISSHPSSVKPLTERLCFENLANVWTYYGRTPRYREMFEPPSDVKGKAYDTRWGTWRKALTAFVFWANSEDSSETTDSKEPLVAASLKMTILRRSEADRREIRPALRFKVFRRDGFRCVTCGRSPATHMGVELHADHILAVVNGGKTTFENLQTLCQECNLGKGRI